jgi:hypothetical protein
LFKRAKDAGWTGNPHDDGRSLADIFKGHDLGAAVNPDVAHHRPVVEIRESELPRVVDQAEAALVAADTNIYKFGVGLLVKIGQDEFITTEGKNKVSVRLVQVNRAAMAETFDRVVQFQKWDARSQALKPKSCPPQVADTYLSREDWKVKKLAGVIRAPTLRYDGSILEKPGYDPQSGLYFVPGDTDFPPIPQNPTKADAIASLELLRGLIQSFPFQDEPSRSVALSMFLSVVVRRSISNCPLHVVTAPTQGSGKSLLVDTAATLESGEAAPVISQAGSEELEKRIGSELIAGAPVINIDNVSRPLEGDLLNSLLTQSTLHVRILGQSKIVAVSGSIMLFATGNNIVVKGDLTRRTLLCSIDPAVERPELRDFDPDSNPAKVVKADRGQYVLAALTILRAYFVAGRPPQKAKPLGSFEEWSRTVRDALMWLGCADPVTTMDKLREHDPVRDAQGALHIAWKDAVGLGKVSVQGLIKATTVTHGGDPQKSEDAHALYDALFAVAGKASGGIDPQKVGFYLASHQGKIINGLTFRFVGTTNKQKRYQLFSAITPAAANDDIDWENYRVGG